MEHVLCSHLSNHLEINNILTPHQHGFRKGFSTETQLISVLEDWLSSLDKRIRMDVLLNDFSKAFDSVPHQRLLLKLNYYGNTGNSLSWIKKFLLDRCQQGHLPYLLVYNSTFYDQKISPKNSPRLIHEPYKDLTKQSEILG